jgi:hypothetical protein
MDTYPEFSSEAAKLIAAYKLAPPAQQKVIEAQFFRGLGLLPRDHIEMVIDDNLGELPAEWCVACAEVCIKVKKYSLADTLLASVFKMAISLPVGGFDSLADNHHPSTITASAANDSIRGMIRLEECQNRMLPRRGNPF